MSRSANVNDNVSEINQHLQKLAIINRLAHKTRDPRKRRQLYRQKDQLVSAAIVSFGDRCRCSYQLFHGRVFVVVVVRGSRLQTYHQPFECLSGSAQARVYNSIGSPQ